jgi:ubiquinone/menaquinone biosynthesis C-methylase UbiE
MKNDAYRLWSTCYDWVIEPVIHHAKLLGLEMWPPKASSVVLDIGCGTGAQLQLYQEKGCTVVGVDRSPSMIRKARERLGKKANLELLDAEQLPYDANAFDLILLSMTLHELQEDARTRVLNEIRRVAKDDGRVLVFEYHRGPPVFSRGFLARPLVLMVERLAGLEHYRNYKDFIARGGLPALASRNNFNVEQARVIDGGTFGLFLLSIQT